MVEVPVIDIGEWPGFTRRLVSGPSGPLSVRIGGAADGAVVLLNHSILTSSAIWRRQAERLAARGYRVVCLDSRGHGHSPASAAPYAMADLVADNIAVLDALSVDRAHYVGVSQGGMTGLGLGIGHADRLFSLCICAARADAPAPFAAGWDDRIAVASGKGVQALAIPTAERWFGAAFLEAHPQEAQALLSCIAETSVEGFIGCAQAIQGLDYLANLGRITTPTMLLIGSRDETLLQPMRDLQPMISNARLSVIEDAGHLPQIDQPDSFDSLLFARLSEVMSA